MQSEGEPAGPSVGGVNGKHSTKEVLATFVPGCSVVAVDFARAPDISQKDAEALFQSLLRGERGARLRAQLGSLHPSRSEEDIEEAVQTACKRFVDGLETLRRNCHFLPGSGVIASNPRLSPHCRRIGSADSGVQIPCTSRTWWL